MQSIIDSFPLLVLICLLFIRSGLAARNYCFTGSSEYQLVPVECATHNSSVNAADWYCATMEICEQYKNTERKCMTTRGCATAVQCRDPATNAIYDGTNIYTSTSSLIKAGGMEVKTWCCQNNVNDFSDDDGIAPDLSGVCNEGSRLRSASIMISVSYIFVLICTSFYY